MAILLFTLSSATSSPPSPITKRGPIATSALTEPSDGIPHRNIGSLNISSRCPFKTWYSFADGSAYSTPWTPVPKGGFLSPFSNYTTNFGAEVLMNFSFSNDGTDFGALHGSQLRMAWLQEAKSVRFNIIEDYDYRWNFFAESGYMAWPDPEHTLNGANCTKKHCKLNELPHCEAAYPFGKSSSAVGRLSRIAEC
jgi:hypothetical protein